MKTDIASLIADLEENIKTNTVSEPRVIPEMNVGEFVRQGDIYIHRVKADHSRGRQIAERQLAQGNTKGSRHVAEMPSIVFEGTTAPPDVVERTFLGPCIVAEETFTISHPEHPHVIVGPGTYQITHQMNPRTLQRVKD